MEDATIEGWLGVDLGVSLFHVQIPSRTPTFQVKTPKLGVGTGGVSWCGDMQHLSIRAYSLP